MSVNKKETLRDSKALQFNQSLLTEQLNILNQSQNRLNLIELFIETRESEIAYEGNYICLIYYQILSINSSSINLSRRKHMICGPTSFKMIMKTLLPNK